ncbi:MAG: hypothetical protein PHF67_00040 [Candidatus Nanoarchaeia archaeon]|nr:hypothetical protein [Candidatus Nanoarchaeia archaeon]
MLLVPSSRTLELIGWDENSFCKWTEIQVDGFSPVARELGFISHVAGYVLGLPEFYSTVHRIILNEQFMKRHHFDLVNDALRNALEHGSVETGKNTPYCHGVFFGSKGICNGFQDQGGYYKRPEIKRIFEAKNWRLLQDLQPRIGYGVQFICDLSDLVEVDTEKGILYCSQLIKPEHIERRIERDKKD